HNLKLAPLHVDGDPVETAEHIYIQVHRQLLSLIVPKA
ncbi:MAG: diacylglycerol kinase, partial [Bacteroidetes bacterium]